MWKRVFEEQWRDSEQGQSLVEIALTITIMIIIFSGVLDLGRVYFAYLALQDAAAEGAAYGLMNPTWHDSTDNPNPNNVEYRARNEAPSGAVVFTNTVVTTQAPFATPGNKITVSVTYDYDLITPFVQLIAGGPTIKITGTAVQTIVSPP
jgi:Flp pilus assembly protein TadG